MENLAKEKFLEMILERKWIYQLQKEYARNRGGQRQYLQMIETALVKKSGAYVIFLDKSFTGDIKYDKERQSSSL